jgi:hypothetical protein
MLAYKGDEGGKKGMDARRNGWLTREARARKKGIEAKEKKRICRLFKGVEGGKERYRGENIYFFFLPFLRC